MADAPPPAYEDATKSKKADSSRPTTYAGSAHLDVPRNGIPPEHRRSMEDEGRPLPAGWIRQYDAKESHQYFVDTNSSPPRSIWHHPYDDEQYLSTLTAEERERLESATKRPSTADIAAAESDIEDTDDHHHQKQPKPSTSTSGEQNPNEASPHGLHKFGRKLKDTLTGTTHTEREQARERREKEEQEAYRRYNHIRSAMTRAAETGQPQLLGKNAQGQDVYIEPPPRTYPCGNVVYGADYGRTPGGYHGYNPYTQGPFANPSNRFVPYPRPAYAYSGRPYGYGYGGGMGLPLMGGLLGGMALGGLLW